MSRRKLRVVKVVNATRAVIECLEHRRLLALVAPALSSLPGSPHNLYLDFTGDIGFTNNPPQPVFDLDNDPTSFSPLEIDTIKQIWEGVSDAYSPFDVNVTTVSPGANDVPGKTMGIMFGGIPTGFIGGDSPVGAFTLQDNRAHVYNEDPGPGNLAQVAEHEAGHGFGLSHQSTPTDEYREFDGQVGAIMSASYNGRTLWWNGYSKDTNANQDDMAILASALGYRPDDYTNDPTAGTALSLVNGSAQVSGIISNDSDQDWFTLNWSGGAFTLIGRGAVHSNKLDPRLEVRDSTGNTLLASGEDPAVGQTLEVNLPAGTYRIGIMSGSHLDNGVSTHYGEAGEYTLQVLSGTSTGEQPFGGAPAEIGAADPTTIQYEDYDFGGEGLAYHSSNGFYDNGYRGGEGVSLLFPRQDILAYEGYVSNDTTKGDWTNYTVNVDHAGTYALAIRSSSPSESGTFHLELDGQNVSGELTLAATGNYTVFRTTISPALLTLPAGQHILRLVWDSTVSQGHINWFQLVPVSAGGQLPVGASPFEVAANAPSTLEVEDFDNGGQGVSYNDTTPDTNTGGAYRPSEGVDIKSTTDSGGGFRISDAFTGEWLEYSINVDATGTYDLTTRVGSPAAGGTFHLELDGQMIGSELTVPNTGSYDTMQDVTIHGVQLTAGAHLLRLAFDNATSTGSAGGFNFIRFTPVAAPSVSVAASDPTAYYITSDPGRPANNGTFTITRTGPIDTDLWVSFAMGGTAFLGSDYGPLGSAFLIPAGQGSADVILGPNGPPGGHTQSTAIMTLASGSFYSVIANNSATVNISLAPPIGQISGVVFGDLNNDGIQESGEPSFGAQTVYIDQNNDGIFEQGEPTATTTGPGTYTLPYLDAGTYIIRPILTNGYVQSAPANNAAWTVTLTQGQVVSGIDFGITQPQVGTSTISGTVFNDMNDNGSRDGGDSGVSGRTIFIDLNNNGLLDSNEQHVLTNSSGNYEFTGLLSGTYDVAEVVPFGWAQTSPASNAPLTVSLSTGEHLIGETFGTHQLPAANGKISGEVYNDANNNGAKNSGEAGLVGRTVFIDLDNDSVLDPNEQFTTTDASGNYSFTGLAAGSYKVREVIPAGWTQTTPTKNYGWSITLAANQSVSGKDFGAHLTPVNSASIAGTIFNDTNGNGKHDSSEAGLASRTLYIDLNNDSKQESNEPTTTTLASGAYQFTNLAAGTYKVRQVLPSGWSQTTPASGFGWSVTVIANQAATGMDFGARQTVAATASISGTIFNDKNGNGSKDSGESGIAGREVYIDLDNDSVLDPNEVFVKTDSSGNFKFTGLVAGTYKIRQVLPSGSKQTTPSNGFGISMTVTAGQSATGKNFGAKTG